MTQNKQWLPGMYVMLKDFEYDYDLAVVEDWGRSNYINFTGLAKRSDCIGSISGDLDYWKLWPRDITLTTRITPTQALEIVRNSREVKL